MYKKKKRLWGNIRNTPFYLSWLGNISWADVVKTTKVSIWSKVTFPSYDYMPE